MAIAVHFAALILVLAVEIATSWRTAALRNDRAMNETLHLFPKALVWALAFAASAVWFESAQAQLAERVEMRPGDFGDEAWFLWPSNLREKKMYQALETRLRKFETLPVYKP